MNLFATALQTGRYWSARKDTLVLSGATGIIILGLIAQPEFSSTHQLPIAPKVVAGSTPLPYSVRAEILNGCGVSQVATRLTLQARQMGIDVIHEGNADHFGYLHTVVIQTRWRSAARRAGSSNTGYTSSGRSANGRAVPLGGHNHRNRSRL